MDELCAGRVESLIPVELFRSVIALRRKLHRNPELAFKETFTAATIRAELAEIEGVDVLQEGVGGTGVIAIIEGEDPHGGPTILFRADMDALPITEAAVDSSREPSDERETKRRKFACCALCGGWPLMPAQQCGSAEAPQRQVTKAVVSAVDGVSHACGHDGHVAMLVGAAKLIAARRPALRGRLVLLFQPAEERHPLSNPLGGAIHMIRDQKAGRALAARLGVSCAAGDAAGANGADADADARPGPREADGSERSYDSPLLSGVDEVYGCHLWNYASAGTVGVAPGSVTANSDSLQLLVRGTGGHASAPQGTVDAVVVASQLVGALQNIVSRNVSPTESAVRPSAARAGPRPSSRGRAGRPSSA